MATSFLQFCATCERQIYTPCNTLLYCSDACRRVDSAKPISTVSRMPSSGLSAPAVPTQSSLAMSSITRSTTPIPNSRIPVDAHTASIDLDPTEWKPKLSSRSRSSNSEAARFLARFHHNATPTDHENKHFPSPAQHSTPASAHTSTTSIFSLNPTNASSSLAHSPITASSSYSASADYFNRPLPPRQDPLYASSAGTTRSVDLVIPQADPTGTCDTTGNLTPDCGLWQKRAVKRSSSKETCVSHDGLATLFAEKK